MAGFEFLWTFVVQEALKKVVKVAAQEIAVAWGFKKELEKLTKWLLKSEAILRDIITKKLYNEPVRMWVEDLQHFVYEADDLLDELVYEDLRRKAETEKIEKKVHNFFSCSHNPFLFRRKMAKRMKDITETLYKHYCEASPLGLVALVGHESTEARKNIDLKQIRDTTSKLKPEEVIIGREVEVSNIVKLVIESSNEHPMSIIPIVGMGGLGKTTLAKMVFNHGLVQTHFDKTLWVCVSEPFIIINILEGIFQSLTKTSSSCLNKENLLQRLQEEMRGNNYFLVLDDVWNEEAILWDNLKDCLNEIAGKPGNTIIVTTRSPDVATVMGTTSSIHLKKLSDDLCWSLFKKGVSADGLELEIIREEVVTKIGGIPLVAKVLGGAVKFEGNYERWMTKFKSVVKNISKDDKDFISSILKLSVDCLPLLSLKQCFAYCSNFPKDYKFCKESLIQTWIAQGFIQPQEEDNELMMEDIGEGYFDLLLSRSLFEVVDEDSNERTTHFKMHDLIHDIACAISNQVESNLHNSSEKSVRKLRTIIHDIDNSICDKFEDLVCLRVLVFALHPGWDVSLFNSIGIIAKHLRYLEIKQCYHELKYSLESIAMLYNLQTLKLGVGASLPTNLRKLVKLRHLEFKDIGDGKMPLHMRQLIHLQTLTAFFVGEDGCKIEELGPLKNLKGSLDLGSLGEVKSKEEAMGARLIEKKNLTKLAFYWNSSSEEEDNLNELEVLEGLQPHNNLQSLSILHYNGQAFPNNIFVEGLVHIMLHGCMKCEMLPMLGQLPNLEELVISEVDSVKSIGREFYGSNNSNQRVCFPKLKKFSLMYMENLENWEDVPNDTSEDNPAIELPQQLGYLTTLKLLEIFGFEGIEALPDWLENLACLEELKLYYCKNLKWLPSKHVMLSLTKLNRVEVKGCPLLPLGEGDPERAKLSHFPNHFVKVVFVQSSWNCPYPFRPGYYSRFVFLKDYGAEY
ncbi:disease resistance protein RGA2-like isoform X2 [Benincasa hispida]|uniref:disease resistance protein RGA2-like isoform X2 n=1 Tax=Benincasa hispida TaxID=102211 RepID=UPI0019006CF2|nr:disease resistance protein RGA2-like isoform X2 [Benincasa hispida]